ncbi:MAG: TIGR03032 family protein [Pirellulaceae bacterium]
MNEPSENELRFVASEGFCDWLASLQISLALTSYRSGKIFLVGLKPGRKLSIFERTFARCMGMWSDGQTIWIATLYELWRFENFLRRGQTHEDYDACYVPVEGRVTGDLNVHDVAVDHDGRLIFVNTLFNCLASVSERHSFRPLWRPPFIKHLVAEDHCHLNGMAMEDGRPRFASMFATVDENQGWREHRLSGGCVIDVTSGQYVVEGLSMPHSPRLYRGRLWLLHSGTGYFGYVDVKMREFIPLTFCPGYVRGLAFIGDYAIIGTSKGREENMFQELPLHRSLKERNQDVCCGLSIIDLRTSKLVHCLWIEGPVTQMYDVAVLPGIVRPMALGFKTDEIQRMVSIEAE